MEVFTDYKERTIRLTNERREHLENNHPEMAEQLERVEETLENPDVIVTSRTDEAVELFYTVGTAIRRLRRKQCA